MCGGRAWLPRKDGSTAYAVLDFDVGDRWANTYPMFPQTPAATAALSVATRFYSPALLNHCIRSYLWGTMYAAAHRIAFDDQGCAARSLSRAGIWLRVRGVL